MMFSDCISGLRQPGSSAQHHQLTHDEALDPAIGYQPEATEFVYASMEAWADFVEQLAAIPEGDGTLRPGVHVRGATSPSTRVGLTLQQVMGLNVESWGSRSMEATQPVSEILL